MQNKASPNSNGWKRLLGNLVRMAFWADSDTTDFASSAKSRLGYLQAGAQLSRIMPTSILERFKLNGRTALVTGAGQGIGEALAHALAQAGAKVAVVDVNGANAEKVAGAINSYNKEAIAVTCDIRFPEQVSRIRKSKPPITRQKLAS